MMEPSKSGALGPGGYLNDDGPPTAQVNTVDGGQGWILARVCV